MNIRLLLTSRLPFRTLTEVMEVHKMERQYPDDSCTNYAQAAEENSLNVLALMALGAAVAVSLQAAIHALQAI